MSKIKNLPEAGKFAIYFNVLAITLLGEEAEQFSPEPSQEEPQAFVDDILERIETPVNAGVEAVEEVESESDELQETVLW